MEEYPRDIPDVQTGLAELSQKQCLCTLDELMSRRGHNHRLLEHIVAVNRRDRVAWRDARDAKEAKREEEAEE